MAIEEAEEEYHHEQPESSDDDAPPEEVGKETAKQDALEQLERERSAKTAVAEAAKTKRRAEIERNTEQQRAKRERQTSSSLHSIPYDLLAKVAAKRKEEEDPSSEPEETSLSKSKPRPPQKSKIRTSVFSQPRELETQATTFTAVNLASSSELTSPLIALRKDKSSCFAFRDRMLFDRKRLKRIHSGTVASYQAKRAALKHS